MDKPLVPIVIVAGLGRETRVIGKNNGLLWHVPEDLKRFKSLTMGHPIIMGRKTFESILAILGKPFPGRTNIVITRNTDYHYEGVIVVTSLEAALAVAGVGNPAEIHIGGGAEIYKQALPYVSRLHLTFFEGDKDGDTFFPEFENDFVITKEYEKMKGGETEFQWVDFERKTV
jgi:dihydrofolate reductase